MKNRFMAAGMFVLVGMLAVAAMAQGDPSKAFWGFNPSAVSGILGFIGPFLVSLIAKSSWARANKRWLVVGITGVVTLGLGVYVKALTRANFGSDVIWATLTSFFTVATLTYQSLERKFDEITAKAGNTEKKITPASVK